MDWKLKEVIDKEKWEKMALEFSEFTFLLSWNWGEVEKKAGNRVIRFGFFEKEELKGGVVLVLADSKGGRFGFCPHGPVFLSKKNFEDKMSFFLKEIEKVGRKEKANFIRIGPLIERNWSGLMRKLKLVKAPTHIYTDNFLRLRVDKDEEELLAKMRKTTRNLIKKGEKTGIRVKKSKDNRGVNCFYQLLLKTALRHKFVPFGKKFILSEFEIFKKNDQVVILEGFYKGKVFSSAVIIFYGESGFYHHGASVLTKAPVSYFVQWEAIKEAKRRGKKYYNFWGFSDSDDKKHPFYGITHFKKGFGPEEIIFLKNYDFIISKKYWINYIIDSIRRLKRGH